MFLKFALVVYFYSFLSFCLAVTPFGADLDNLWQDYKVKYKKAYNGVEEHGRRLIWEQNVLMIEKHNLEADMGKHTYWMGINHFTDWTVEEWDQMRNCLIIPKNYTIHESSNFGRSTSGPLPESVDWRDKGYVTDVKDQGNCGSCWAFSTTGSLEGQLKASSGKLVSLSEQNLVDCSWGFGNYGCNGGWMIFALSYVEYNGIDTEESYPYRAVDDDCHFNPSTVGAKITSYDAWISRDEELLQEAVATVGPISVAISVGNNFMHYKTGVFSDTECNNYNLNHGVLAVGYGTVNELDYWIVKNSWSKSWGEDGYIRMVRNRGNNCGIASFPAYPIM